MIIEIKIFFEKKGELVYRFDVNWKKKNNFSFGFFKFVNIKNEICFFKNVFY